MTIIRTHNAEKWMHQNNATVLDIVEGVLNDNYLVDTDRGFAGLYLVPENSWTSSYRIEFGTVNECNRIFENWEEFKAVNLFA